MFGVWRGVFCMLLCLCAGCSSLAIKIPESASYTNGIAIMHSQKAKSKVQLEIAQEIVGGFNLIPFIIYIAAENLSEETIFFAPSNVSLYVGEKNIAFFESKHLRNITLNVTQALYDYSIEVTSPNNRMIYEPFFYPDAYRFYPVPFMLDSGFFLHYRFYDYSFARARYAQYNATNNARMFLVAHYLRKNTLKKHDVKGGFLLVHPSVLKAGVLLIRVQIGEDIHEFSLYLSKP